MAHATRCAAAMVLSVGVSLAITWAVGYAHQRHHIFGLEFPQIALPVMCIPGYFILVNGCRWSAAWLAIAYFPIMMAVVAVTLVLFFGNP